MDTRPNIVSYNVVPLTTLTERQRQVATLACQGFSNREIAKTLGVAEGTVKIHLNVICEKLNVRSRTDLIIRFGAPQRVARTLRVVAEYRQHAKQRRDLAARTSNPTDKKRLKDEAKAWAKMAALCERNLTDEDAPSPTSARQSTQRVI